MAQIHRFGAVLARLRKGHGFDTAHSFYKKRGGQRGLGLSFANYLALEKGRSLPKGSRLLKILEALGLVVKSKGARELVRAYVRDVLGSDKLMRAISEPQSPDPLPPIWSLAETASRQALKERSVQLSLEQYSVIAMDPIAYACHVVLLNTHGSIEKVDLAKVVGQPLAQVSKALKALKKARMIAVQGARVRNPSSGKFLVPPNLTPQTSAIYAAMLKTRGNWIKERGRMVFNKHIMLRLPASGVERYLPHLNEMIRMGAVFGDAEKQPGSGVYMIEGRVVRLFK